MNTVFDLEREGAVISKCQRYRYALYRKLESINDKPCLFIMLNPSTADHKLDDPTIRRCIRFARDWGCSDLFVGNLFAWRTAFPAELRANGVGGGDVIGPDNKEWIERLADVTLNRQSQRGPIVCAWGTGASYMRQGETVLGWLEETYPLQCLGTTKDGYPKHPLYLPADSALIPFSMQGVAT